MADNKSFDSLDLTKWICALMVVIIHANPFQDTLILSFYVKDVLARVAVPMFFAISGYLFFKKITFENRKIARNSDNIKYLLRYVKHLSLIYLFASVFYLLYRLQHWYSIGWWGISALKDYLSDFLLSGSEYHLWYILASIYGIVLFYIILLFIRIDVMKHLCIVCWVIECMLYSYSWIGIDNIDILNCLTSHFSVCFDAVFRAIPLMAVGLFCAQKPKTENCNRWLFYSVIAFLGWTIEASCLYFLTPNDGKYSYIFFTPLFTYFMLNYLLSVNFKFVNPGIPKLMRDTSLIIYIIHPMVIYLLDILIMPDDVIRWLLVTAISIMVSVFLFFMKSK